MKRRREESVETAASISPASVIENMEETSMEPETEEAARTQDDEVIET